MDELGLMLRSLRRRLRLSQTEMGLQLGVSRATICRWESGLCRVHPSAARYLAVWAEDAGKTDLEREEMR